MIPWVALLKHAPAIAVAAETLLARARKTGTDAPNTDVDERLARLEQDSRETAELLRDIAQQLNVLTLAQERLRQRVQLALSVGVAGAVLAVIACVLWLLRS